MASQSYLSYKTTRNPKELKLFLKSVLVGILDLKGSGEFRTERKSINRQYNGFGIHKIILEHTKLNFKTVRIIYKNRSYCIERSEFVARGISHMYPEGEKKYLDIRQFRREGDFSQLSLFEDFIGGKND